MAEQKKRKGRRSYLNDFYRDVGGEYQYTGAMRHYLGPEPYEGERKRLAMLGGAVGLGTLAVGVLPAPSMLGIGSFYVILPYVAQLIAAFLSLWAAIRMLLGGPELRSYVYDATVEKLPVRSMLTAVFAAAGILGNALYLILHGFGGRPVISLAVIVLHALVTATAMLLRRRVAVQQWDGGEEEPPRPEE
jgi:hypothetical protein